MSLFRMSEPGVFVEMTVAEVRQWIRAHRDDDKAFCEKHELTTWGVPCPDCRDGKEPT